MRFTEVLERGEREKKRNGVISVEERVFREYLLPVRFWLSVQLSAIQHEKEWGKSQLHVRDPPYIMFVRFLPSAKP